MYSLALHEVATITLLTGFNVDDIQLILLVCWYALSISYTLILRFSSCASLVALSRFVRQIVSNVPAACVSVCVLVPSAPHLVRDGKL